MSNDAPPVGSIRLYDRAQPDLEAGDYRVTSSLDITGNGAALAAPSANTTYVTVSSPRFALAADQVASRHPAPQAKGGFGDRLPHVVLGRRTLPWERSGPGGGPWMALMVVAEGEGALVNGTLGALLPATVVTALKADEPFADDPAVTVLQMTRGDLLAGLLPKVAELPLLAHVRQVNLQDSTLAGTDDDGWFAVVAANRLPQAGAQDTNFLACLVSLEARDDLWAAAGAAKPPAVLVLHAWNFTGVAGAAGSFEALAAGLDVRAFGASDTTPVDAHGTLPLQRVDRQGAAATVHYRGPLLGTSSTPLPADADDVSRACAVELGRLLGSADARFLRETVAWQRTTESQARVALNVQRLAAIVAPVAPAPVPGPPALAGKPLPLVLPNLPQLLSTTIALRLKTDLPRANLWQLHLKDLPP